MAWEYRAKKNKTFNSRLLLSLVLFVFFQPF